MRDDYSDSVNRAFVIGNKLRDTECELGLPRKGFMGFKPGKTEEDRKLFQATPG